MRHACYSGYTTGYVWADPAGNVIIDTRDPDNVSGAVPAFWQRLISHVADQYGATISLEWILFGTSQDAFTGLYNGEIDANCGLWNPSGNWVNDTIAYARPLVFSMMECPTSYSDRYMHSLADSAIDSYELLLLAITETSNNEAFTVCVTGKFRIKDGLGIKLNDIEMARHITYYCIMILV